MASKRGLTYKIRDFLKYRDWIEIDSGPSKFIKMIAPHQISPDKPFDLKIPTRREPIDYCDFMERVLNIIRVLYKSPNDVKILNKYVEELDNTRLKYSKDGNWITKEKASITEPVDPDKPYLPNFKIFSLSLLGERTR